MKPNSISYLLFIHCLLVYTFTFAQKKPSNLSDKQFSTFYQQRLSLFRKLIAPDNSIIFLGNSITNGNEWSELFHNPKILNRGISGDITAGVLNRIDEVTERNPEKVFLLIGVNDLSRNIKVDSILKNIYLITQIIHKESPKTQLYIQSILPVSDHYKLFAGHTGKEAEIKKINSCLNANSNQYNYTFIDLYPYFADHEGKLDRNLSNDGLHLTGSGYTLWQKIIQPYIDNDECSLPLIPYPKEVKIHQKYVHIQDFTKIISVKELENEALFLQKSLPEKLNITSMTSANDKSIKLTLQPNSFTTEAYHLSIQPQSIEIKAADAAGIFYGIQTLIQLIKQDKQILSCEIADEPAFAWRGYMIDVGRNFQTLETIKQQIDKMALYKMNVLHFHPTEDVAWRFAIRKYPQLTAARTMTRQTGKFYSEKDIKELMAYCKERHILFVPEIDMPGHSKAFERALGFSMQSEKGVEAIKNILNEVCETYHFPYIHIGGDEVAITNKNFLPEMCDLLKKNGTKIIGWVPGGNLSKGSIQQLWMKDIPKNDENTQFIDSRHTYINHFDPQESVVTLFNRQFLQTDKGDTNKLGAELCLWHDRKINKEEDLFTMNAVYPSLMAFAERIWKGNGIPEITSNIVLENIEYKKAFSDFEQRLLRHKTTYFNNLPFNYVQQSQMHWKLVGPFDNQGNIDRSFAPEQKDFDFSAAHNVEYANGATVTLRHFWTPFINGKLKLPEENTTWYAYTRFWSDEAVKQSAWLGAYDISRSVPSVFFEADTWSPTHTQFYVNGERIKPPVWHSGKTGDLEIPFSNEGYSYRLPHEIQLKKGWNELLVKLPIDKFNSELWYKPVKWGFTFAFIKTNGEKVSALPGIYDPY